MQEGGVARGLPWLLSLGGRLAAVQLPEQIDYAHYLQLAKEKHRDILRLDLLRQIFNRPLELWLVLDCALYLEEHGYRVKVTQFCEHQLSPRNVLIQAERIAAC